MAQETVQETSDTGTHAAASLPRVRRRIPWLCVAGALLGGLAQYAAFPPLGWWLLAPVGVALVTLAVRGRTASQGAWLGLLGGVGLTVPLLEWLRVIGPDAWLLLAGFEALYFAGLGAAVALVTRLRGWPLWAAALWVTEESVRDRFPFGGFPWGRLAFSQTSSPFAPYAALAGAPLVTFATALAGTLLALAMVRSAAGRRRGVRTAAAALAGVLATGALGALIPVHRGGRPVTVAVIQGNVPRLGLDFLGQREAVLDDHVTETERLAQEIDSGRVPRPDLVIWPENSSDIDPYRNPDAAARIASAARAVGVPLLVGAVVVAPDGRSLENRGIVWDPRNGPGDYYVKRHPVPFGEYVPFRSVLSRFISRFQRVPLDFVPGHRPNAMRIGPVRIGDVICFEVAYDGIVRDAVDEGGQIVVVQTNNATFGRSAESAQQLAMSQLRAVEHGRPVLVAATSGISAIVAQDGQVMARSREFTPDILIERVPASSTRTFADRLGAFPEWALTLVGASAVTVALRSRRGPRPWNHSQGE